MSKRLNLKNQTFNKLTVIDFAYIKNNHSCWLCKCECGNEKIIRGHNIHKGEIKSCGCIKSELMRKKMTKHNMATTRFYGIWHQMKSRCNNKNVKEYKYYGGRGITVCKQWKIFINFRDDMYKNYKEHLKQYGKVNTTIERINNNGNYEPNNCKWATRKEQTNNRRTNHLLIYKGQTLTVSQWARKLNIQITTLFSRIQNNRNIDEILNTTIKKNQYC